MSAGRTLLKGRRTDPALAGLGTINITVYGTRGGVEGRPCTRMNMTGTLTVTTGQSVTLTTAIAESPAPGGPSR